MIVAIALCVQLIYAFIQDSKQRALSLWLLITISVSGLLWSYNNYGVLYLAEYIINMLFLLFMFGGITIFWKIRRGKDANLLKQAFGGADVWMIILLAIMLPPVMFVSNVIIASVTSLLLAIIFRWKTIPLAGVMSLCLTLFVIINQLNII
ncbi:MAG: prepilin peptidase [Bacteroidales bacterium]|jgi:hypothetical protein|nr:prepilin peptidase [Bacteroidales bacterium]